MRVLEREVGPRVPVSRVILPDGAPLPPRQIRSPHPPRGGRSRGLSQPRPLDTVVERGAVGSVARRQVFSASRWRACTLQFVDLDLAAPTRPDQEPQETGEPNRADRADQGRSAKRWRVDVEDALTGVRGVAAAEHDAEGHQVRGGDEQGGDDDHDPDRDAPPSADGLPGDQQRHEREDDAVEQPPPDAAREAAADLRSDPLGPPPRQEGPDDEETDHEQDHGDTADDESALPVDRRRLLRRCGLWFAHPRSMAGLRRWSTAAGGFNLAPVQGDSPPRNLLRGQVGRGLTVRNPVAAAGNVE